MWVCVRVLGSVSVVKSTLSSCILTPSLICKLGNFNSVFILLLSVSVSKFGNLISYDHDVLVLSQSLIRSLSQFV